MEKPSKKSTGFTLIETLIGITLFVLVFSGIFGLVQISFKLVGQSKARITATALANQKIELAHNLPYGQVGTLGGIPAGTIPENATTTLNGIFYNVKTTVTYVDDPFDGLAGADPGPWDYKRVKVKVSWFGFMTGQVELLTDVSPKGIENDAGGGILSLLVFDANGQTVPQAYVHIENNVVTPAIDVNYQTDSQGRLYIPGSPACSNCYKITVTKDNYSTDRTYAVGEMVRGVALANPAKPYPSVMDGLMSELSFTIDRLSSQTIQSLTYVDEKTWNDSFDDASQISEFNQTIASTTASDIRLNESSPRQYYSSGEAISEAIVPTSLNHWSRANWNAVATTSTQIRISLLYATSSSWELIPDSDLTLGGIKNSDGFMNGPIDISDLDKNKYPSLKLKASFATSDNSLTPSLLDWQITWLSDGTTPIANLPFTLQGERTLGTDSAGNPVYKYLANLTTNSSGQLSLPSLEWDSYNLTVNPSTGYDLANSSPPQPVALDPNSSQTTVLKLADHHSQTLLVTVKDSSNTPLPGATVRLYRTGYDVLKISSDSGQAFFSPLINADYNLEIKMAGYQDWTESVGVSGQTEQIVNLSTP